MSFPMAAHCQTQCMHHAAPLRLSAARPTPVVQGFSSALRGATLTSQRAAFPRSSRVHAQTVARQGGAGGDRGDRGGRRGDREQDEFQERVVQVRRVTKVVKGGKQLSFRAVVVVGNERGSVGVGCAAAKEVITAVQKAVLDAKRDLVKVPLSKDSSFPHRTDSYYGAAKVMLRPAAEGTGVIAGGAVRVVLELAGVKNAFGKQLGSNSPLNNARATLAGIASMKTFKQVSADRGISVAELMGLDQKKKADLAEATA